METAMHTSRLALPLLALLLLGAGVASIFVGSMGDGGGVGVPVLAPAGLLLLGAAAVVFAVHRRERLTSGQRSAARVGAGILAVVCGLVALGTIVLFALAGSVGSSAWVLLVVAAALVVAAFGFSRAVAVLGPSATESLPTTL
jgi:hypothetical protein